MTFESEGLQMYLLLLFTYGCRRRAMLSSLTTLVYAPAMKWPGHIVLPPSITPSFWIQFLLIISVIHGDFQMKFDT